MTQSLTEKSILIVDDEPLLRELLESEFEEFGADVSLASSGEEAIELLRNNQFDIVFTDMKMPHGDGMWLITQINKELPQLPKIFLCSGYSSHANESIEELGVIKVFPKPFDFETIVTDIIKLCDFPSA